MPDIDSFAQNIAGVQNLIESTENKTRAGESSGEVGDLTDVLDLPMEDAELIKLSDEWEGNFNGYYPKIKPRQEANKMYYLGRQRQSQNQGNKVVSSNIIFEAEETYIPQALSKNPEPVVWSDNTDEGKQEANKIKTMLQYHADVLCLRRKLAVMVRHNSVYLTGVLKHGWDTRSNDIDTKIRQPKNFIFAPDSYINEKGRYIGDYLGEKIKIKAQDLIKKFPQHAAAITLKVDAKLGTNVIYTEWWNDDFCFDRFGEIILDKHKNPYFNYETKEVGTDEDGSQTETATPGENHFASPEMPYTFLSVFSLQEQPFDETSLIEQSIPNQDDINDEDTQVSRNLRTGNNGIALSGISFDKETARQAAAALEDGDPVLVPDGQVESAIKRLPAAQLPPGLLQALQLKKDTLRSVFGVQGLAASAQDQDDTVRGQILAQSHDSTRIGGGIGDAVEQVADNVFNWWLQLYYVFYDEPHYAAIMGSGRAVEYVMLARQNLTRRFVVSVSPNSMKPKDEVAETNLAIDLANKGWLDPINLFKKLDFPDPIETAKMVTMFRVNPAQYMATFFPEQMPQMQVPGQNLPNNPPDVAMAGQPPDESLGAPPASPSLSQVPINNLAVPQA